MTYLLEQLADHASDLGDETRRHRAGGVVQRRVAALSRGHDEGGMLAEAARQAGIRKPCFVRARLAPKTQSFRRKDGIGDIDER